MNSLQPICDSKLRKAKTLIAQFLLLMALTALTLSAARAAEIKLVEDVDPENNCVIEIVGNIEDGDRERLLDLVWPSWAPSDAEEYRRDGYTEEELVYDGVLRLAEQRIGFGNRPRICLNSLGGSVAVALEIIPIIWRNFGTVIRAEESCSSACALMFLAGSINTEENNWITDRHMHATASLGFHAPSLNLALPVASRELLNNAYSNALLAASNILEMIDHLNMHPTLFNVMISTPPDEMFYVDNPIETNFWGIQVFGVPLPDTITRQHAVNACLRAEESFRRSETFGGDDQQNITSPGETVPRIDLNAEFERFDVSQGNVTGSFTGYLDEASSNCEITINTGQRKGREEIGSSIGHVSFTGYPGLMPIARHHLYNATANLADIARSGGREFLVDNGTEMGVCRTISAVGHIDRHQPCEMVGRRDMVGFFERRYEWESGGTTSIRRSGTGLSVDTFEARTQSYSTFTFGDNFPAVHLDPSFGSCYVKSNEVEAFCFAADSN